VNSRPHPRPFRCHLPAPVSFLSPFLSSSYKRPLPQLLSFDIVTNARGVYLILPTKNLRCYLKFSFFCSALPSLFSLFAPRAFHNSFAIRRIRTLSENCQVYAISSQFETRPSGRSRSLICRRLRTGWGDFPFFLFDLQSEVMAYSGSKIRIWSEPEIPTGRDFRSKIPTLSGLSNFSPSPSFRLPLQEC